MVTPIQTFQFAHTRAEHFLKLYETLHDQRSRGVRGDWAQSFRELMRWPQRENFVRVDGENSILILRQALGISRDEFQHDYVSELLRAATAFSVSALDLYFHDAVVHKSWNLLRKPEDEIPKQLKRISLPILVTKRAVEQLRRDGSSRPSTKIKKELQKALHGLTFQSSTGVKKAFDMLGVENCWGKVEAEMNKPRAEIISKLDDIVKRRNKIVHEADIVLKTKAKRIDKREITKTDVENSITFIRDFVEASDTVINL